MNSREIIGNDKSFSNDFDDKEFFISFNGILLVLELVNWNELKQNREFKKKRFINLFTFSLKKFFVQLIDQQEDLVNHQKDYLFL